MEENKELVKTNKKSSSLSKDEELLLQTIAKGSTPAEFKMFLEFCKATGLNPYKREIWFIKTNGSVQMMTGINGFLAIANRHPQYDGMEVSIEEKDGKLISATAKVYRKDRRFPSVATAYFQEYAKNSPIWRQMPRVMLQKVAKSVALREAFPTELNGIYTQEEMPDNYRLQEVKEEHVYDLSKYEPQDKIEGLIKYFRDRGFEVNGTILKTKEFIEKLSSCEVKGGEDEA